MPYVITRTSKGSPLTTAEMDANLAALQSVLLAFSRNGAWVLSNYFSIGNGESLALGHVMPYAGTITDIALSVDTLATGQVGTVEVYKNGVATGAANRLTLTGTGAAILTSVLKLPTPITFAAGDRLNFFTLAVPATAPVGTSLTMLARLAY